jgi:putative ABC transport system ATP-binding protein
VAIARALVERPDVVLADEPTGNLDSASAEEVLQVLTQVHGIGATIVLVTHDREVAEHATRIVHMLDGRIDSEESIPTPRHRLDPERAQAAT